MNLRQIRALLGLAGFAFAAFPAVARAENRDYPIRPVEFTRVALDDAFWKPRIETNRRVTIPHALRMIEETRPGRQFPQGGTADAGGVPGYSLQRLRRLQGDGGSGVLAPPPPDPVASRQTPAT